MRTQSILSLLAVATAVVAEDAPVIESNPIGAQYEALLKGKKDWSSLTGSVKIASAANGTGVSVEIALAGLPTEGGPFMYHIHEKAVPEDGNCTAAGAHLDPYKRGEVPLCDASKKQTCQTGDLSGKHGNITSTSFAATYNDAYLATLLSDPSYFGDKSIVVHLSNKTRIACANFKQLSPGNASTTASAGSSYGTALPTGGSHGGHNSTASATATSTTGAPIAPTASPTASPAQPPPGSGAAKVAVSGAALFAFVAALMI
ncbi:Cu,Zn superoxide dismutase-like protein [Bimuria novae-zelandiae CBS 107.79]|uniref:superoxide dismutase n=1 Tax=Bimuria novae-zelandiae CBS 107.79 TaxID=1447943 RepID=A0A6A5VEF0_9PLEO|nr:Cu,Zn superoxide dismutase-like protein [Bimuria novae-zelandiae CBS 107.79]